MNAYIDEIIYLLTDWNEDDCMYDPSTLYIKLSYAINDQIHYPDTPTYMKELSGDHTDGYYKAMYEEVSIL